MADRPVLHLTNLSSRRLHGPGALYHIQAAPPRFVREACAGKVAMLAPTAGDFAAWDSRRIEPEEYRRRTIAVFERRRWESLLGPFGLQATLSQHPHRLVDVVDGDTLVCTCARDQAAAGWCHRVWCAPFLHEAGWDVVLDGVRWAPGGEA